MGVTTNSFRIGGLVAVLCGGCARHEATAYRYGNSLKDDTPASSRALETAKTDTRPAAAPSHSMVTERATQKAQAHTTSMSLAPVPAASPQPPPPQPSSAIAASPPPAPPPVSSAPRAQDVLPADPTRAAPPSPVPSQSANDERATARQLLEDGRSHFAQGKVIDARRRFIAALNSSSPEATWALAQSFDPYYLGQLPAGDGIADPARAQLLYRTAIERGAKGAEQDLKRISDTLPKQQ